MRWMRWWWCVALWGSFVAPLAASELPAEVQAALARARVPREAVVMVVRELGTRVPRLDWRSDQSANPASLMKLYTTFAALDTLGPAFTWTTPVWIDGRVEGGVLDGSLVIKGSGDPKLVQERLWLLLRRVMQWGVRDIRGDIVLDRSAFSIPEGDPAAFDGEPLRPYNVMPDALLLNYRALAFTFSPDVAQGVATVTVEPPLAGLTTDTRVPLTSAPCDDFRKALAADWSDPLRPRFAGEYPAACGERVWSVAHGEPRAFNARLIEGLWREMGGQLAGTVKEGLAPSIRPSFEVVSPTLGEVVREVNKFSNNVMAQQVFLTLGRTQRGAASYPASRAALAQWLQSRLGPVGNGVVIDNGSGLSREVRTTGRALDALLHHAWTSPSMPDFIASLPGAGIDGTTRRSRLPPGRAQLKTGSLRDVAAIAGYVLGDTGKRHSVVAIINHPNALEARPALDALVQWAAADGRAPALSNQAVGDTKN